MSWQTRQFLNRLEKKVKFPTKLLNRFVLGVFLSLILVGCGGSDDGSSDEDTSSQFVIISGNANTSGIYDAGGQYFGIFSATRELYSFSHNATVSGVYVNQSFAIVTGGQKIGSVQLVNSTQSGVRVAMLVCNNGVRMDIALSSSGWRYAC